MDSSKKKLLGILTIGAVGGGLLYNMTGTASGETNGNGNDNADDPEEDEMVVATEIEELTGNQRYTFKEYSSNDAPASLNPFNAVGGGKLDIRGSSGSKNQYEWKGSDSKLKLIDHDGVGWFGGDDSGAMHMKVAKGFAVKVKLVSENTDYFSEFSGLSEALANRDSKMKVVGSSKGDTITQIIDDIQRIWENDKMTFMMYEGDYISIDIDSEHDNIAAFRIQIDGVKYDNGEGAIDDGCSIKLKKVYKVTPVDVWASETFTLGSETIVFAGIGAGIGGGLRRVGKRAWLNLRKRVGTKGMRQKAKQELGDMGEGFFRKKSVQLGKPMKNVKVTNVTDDLVRQTGPNRLKAVLGRGAREGDDMGWKFLKGFPIVRTATGAGILIGIITVANLAPEIVRNIGQGPPCSETCDGYDEGSEEEMSCLDDCVSAKDRNTLIIGSTIALGGCVVAYLILSRLVPKKKAEKEE
tara:strand:+ start:5638 stop:7038 length:1401 start_codon:yes stop_codon:yes gene_type:complete